jgi:hypothetical protein
MLEVIIFQRELIIDQNKKRVQLVQKIQGLTFELQKSNTDFANTKKICQQLSSFVDSLHLETKQLCGKIRELEIDR